MYIEKNEAGYHVWVNHENRDSYRTDPVYMKAVSDSKAEGSSMCVFIGGVQPLLPAIDELLHSKDLS